ncbi:MULTISPECIES: type II toxin-antitoxin system HicB family antitoxin [Bacillus]|uniref:type II toxin-antitoxin system HicB family antitoxin n=1 Tax=Bacillus TaxID=1386 RepID=UPI00084B1E05|nr:MULTISPECIES: type II toxin-antitoxin system HicB family antitoxin [Bacillus]MCY8747266.1 type II toxin-antitoxin system HicB family antitoxin [Bacillus spizizenii]MCY8438216.1 type II toxin-antitoxin system HicB family antitoxin [Bacillus haynesii]MCY8796240.1 type II toxin-antitoxin system HicB family antitoxin [Bacillus inaquosorum]MCY8803663.1 type II toxin-antitoxin system HicB family antitoxin [Bacillus spizizenii]MEC0772052.1 type II toxin-antitoxin system HicB family antitoxin [Baci
MAVFKYYAKIDREKLDGTGLYMVSFPDLENCFTYGETMQEAVAMAHDALRELLAVEEQQGNHIPKASDIKDIDIEAGASYVLIEVATDKVEEAS